MSEREPGPPGFFLIFITLGVLSACRGEPGRTAVDSHGTAESCAVPSGPGRWTVGGGGFRETGRVGDDEETWFASVGGVHWSQEGVYVFDAGNARVVRFTDDLVPLAAFGREGDGPGEFPRLMLRMPASPRRIHGGDGRLVVYDERRVSVFDAGGRYLGSAIPNAYEAGLSPMTRAIRLAPSGVLFESDGHDAYHAPRGWTDSVVFRIRRWGGGAVDTVVEVRVARPPRDRRGAQFRGPNQALPLWDVAGGCVVVSDGASPWLVVASLDGAGQDTIRFPLPDREPPPPDREAMAELLGAARGETDTPEPTSLRRIHDLIVDPDGAVWLLPVQPERAPASGVEILRVDLGTRQATTDTVPYFPAAFGPPGVYYATPRDSLRQQLVVRVESQTTRAPPLPRSTDQRAGADTGWRAMLKVPSSMRGKSP